ncbi:MAG: AMP-binding protein, partial [Flavobacteriaceae bacterium]|nr:AMP-binding protein [Flavobacteriaceae bacterium]
MLSFHPQFRLNNHQFKNADELLIFAQSIGKITHQFLQHWFDESAFLKVTTSGSTGHPKEINLKKEYMINSAKATGSYFKLNENISALLCMSPEYIAGKMMLVRAMVLGWKLDVVDAESNPLQHTKKSYDFCAMVPLQVEASLSELHRIKILIIGGGTVSNSLKNKLQNIKTEVYATFGMTETITHIALQKLNHQQIDFFECLPDIKVSKDARNCLMIEAPKIADEIICTNDLVEIINQTSFKWLGRFDHV